MYRYIDIRSVEEMLENAHIVSDGEYCGYCTEDIDLSCIPPVDAMTVIRCNDCAKWHTVQCAMHCEGVYGGQFDWAKAEDFCSYAERKIG